MQNFKKTKYPSIFKKCYWGLIIKNETLIEICHNRNSFKEQFNIIYGRGKNAPQYILKELYCDYNDRDLAFYQDHFEIYETTESYIGVFSNYGKKNKDIQNAEIYGYIIYNNLYNKETTTMIKEVKKKKYR